MKERERERGRKWDKMREDVLAFDYLIAIRH